MINPVKNRLLYIANWKMNYTTGEARVYFDAFLPSIKDLPSENEVVIVPPFTLLPLTKDLLEGSRVNWGAQNMFYEKRGAYTGEISPLMIKDLGGTYVLLGHSERRAHFEESSSLVARKLALALEIGLNPVVCVGENLKERQAGKTFKVLERQLSPLCKAWRDSPPVSSVIIAYEPVWAIGTGINATPAQAQEAHNFIKTYLTSKGISKINVLYGGSVNSKNVASLVEQPDVSGCLVGGSSLDPEEFKKIIFTRKEVTGIGSR